jgi:hypothetical protein
MFIVIKSKIISFLGHVACVNRIINAYRMLVRKPEWMRQLQKCLVLLNEIDLIALEAVQMFYFLLSRDIRCAGYLPYGSCV